MRPPPPSAVDVFAVPVAGATLGQRSPDLTLPAALLLTLESAGFALAGSGDKLTVQPASKLTAEQRAEIVTHKAGLLLLVADRLAIEELDRLVCGLPPPLSVVGWVVGSGGAKRPGANGEKPVEQPVMETHGMFS